MGKEVIALEYHADLLPHLRNIAGVFPNALSIQQNLSALNVLQGIDAAKKGAFPAAGRSDHDDDLPFPDRKGQVIQNSMTAIRFIQMLNCQQRLFHAFMSAFSIK